MQLPHTLGLTDAAYQREAERLRHMAHRAARCRDLTPIGMNADRWSERLERRASNYSKGN